MTRILCNVNSKHERVGDYSVELMFSQSLQVGAFKAQRFLFKS